MTPRRAALLVMLSITLAVWPSAASGIENESFGLTPYPEQADGAERGTFSIPLEPGAVFEDAVRIYNRTDQPLDLVVYAADAEAAPDDTDITAGFRTSRPRGVGSWIDLARETVELAARDEVVVSFRVDVKTSEPNPNLGAIVVENTAKGLSGSAAQREFLPVRTVSPNSETASVRVRPLLLRSPWIVVAMLGLVVAIALVWIGARRARRPKDVLVPAGEIEQAEVEPQIVPEASRPVIKRLGAPDTDARARTSVIAKERAGDDRPLLDDALLVEVEAPDEEPVDDTSGDLNYEDEEEEEDESVPFEDEEHDREKDLPPARSRSAPKRSPAKTAGARKTKPKSKPKPKPRASTKASPKKKPARPAAKRRAPARKASPAPKPAQSRGYIPLDDL